MASFSPFVDLLAEIEDPRRAEGKLYRLPQVVLFAILAIVAGANSYRAIHSFIDVHLAQLRDAFGVKWRKAPAYTTIRGILRQLDPASVPVRFSEWRAGETEPPPESLSDADAVIHLAGEPVAQRWTTEVKQRIRDSRVDGTRHLVNALSDAVPPPASAGLCFRHRISTARGAMKSSPRRSPPGTDFLARVAVDWEEAARWPKRWESAWSGCGFGMVLGDSGGALAKCCLRSASDSAAGWAPATSGWPGFTSRTQST